MRTLILGAGGFGVAVREALQLSLGASHCEVHFLDDAYPSKPAFPKIDIVGKFADLQKIGRSYDNALVALGRNDVRRAQIEAIKRLGMSLATVIHPSAIVSSLAQVDGGSIIMGASVISAGCRIGQGVIINAGTILDHDVVAEDYTHLSIGCRIASGVHIGRSSTLYAGCVAGYGVSIEKNSVAAAGYVFRV